MQFKDLMSNKNEILSTAPKSYAANAKIIVTNFILTLADLILTYGHVYELNHFFVEKKYLV